MARREGVGKWGRFLVAQADARGWNQERAFAELREGLKLGPKSRASYYNLEKGRRQPKPHEVEFLTRFYGAEPLEGEPEPSRSDTERLIRAQEETQRVLQEQTALLQRQALASERQAKADEQIAALLARLLGLDGGDPEGGLSRQAAEALDRGRARLERTRQRSGPSRAPAGL